MVIPGSVVLVFGLLPGPRVLTYRRELIHGRRPHSQVQEALLTGRFDLRRGAGPRVFSILPSDQVRAGAAVDCR